MEVVFEIGQLLKIRKKISEIWIGDNFSKDLPSYYRHKDCTDLFCIFRDPFKLVKEMIHKNGGVLWNVVYLKDKSFARIVQRNRQNVDIPDGKKTVRTFQGCIKDPSLRKRKKSCGSKGKVTGIWEKDVFGIHVCVKNAKLPKNLEE